MFSIGHKLRLVLGAFSLLLFLEYTLNIFGIYSIGPIRPTIKNFEVTPTRESVSYDRVLRSATASPNTGRSLEQLTNDSLSEEKPTAAQPPEANLTNSPIIVTTISPPTTTSLPLCPDPPPGSVGRIPVNQTSMTLEEVEKRHSALMAQGGFYTPSHCMARFRVAIIIPFRDREEHLYIFLNHMIPFLQKQLLEFTIYVVELTPGVGFNRAMLMNIGYAEAVKEHDWQCFVFHDVDLLPEDDRNIYSCPSSPRHMSAAVGTMSYKLPYAGIFGGVTALSKSQFTKVNGYPNRYFGWGGEDDDMHNRVVTKKLKIIRYPINIARYTMIKHKKDKDLNKKRFAMIKQTARTQDKDGLNTLSYKLYELKKVEKKKLYTNFLVFIDQKAVENSWLSLLIFIYKAWE